MLVVGGRPLSVGIIWRQGTEAFAFLIEQWDFLGPERSDDGLAFHRPDLHVAFEIWAWNNEAGIDTTVRRVDPATGEQQSAGLACLYAQAGLGPAQHVPSNIGGGHTIVKRVTQHARVRAYRTNPD
jgi:hypothetical protein